MKNILTVLVLTAATVSAQADIIKCVFTEPFVDSEYSMTQSTLTYKNLINEQGEIYTKVVQNVSFQIKGAGSFELVAKNGTVLQTLTLNMKGSDGMSDRDYPYEARDTNEIAAVNSGTGGCTSNHLKAIEADFSK